MIHRLSSWLMSERSAAASEPVTQQCEGASEEAQQEEMIQTIDKLELGEQLRIIRTAARYLDEYGAPGSGRRPGLKRGYALQSEMVVTYGEEPIFRVYLDVFEQHSSGKRSVEQTVCLVRFGTDEWHVLQVN
ncbi:hypothetical protein [Paenibacillus sp. SYP-B4298]|uniref:hypothetical protein n=1 Tax=Paenibacillus sp. SYP-B4298 TaxID=2996034 RepID=UPI0022DE2332|nr:hypothetical protein [Paenibacillus sp. SYP-B4298]